MMFPAISVSRPSPQQQVDATSDIEKLHPKSASKKKGPSDTEAQEDYNDFNYWKPETNQEYLEELTDE